MMPVGLWAQEHQYARNDGMGWESRWVPWWTTPRGIGWWRAS